MKCLVNFASKLSLLFKRKTIKKPKEEVPMEQYTIVIDPGHGGKDSGAVGEYSEEKKLNLIYSNILYDLIEQDYHFIPLITRDRDQYYSLKYRVDFTKEKNADMFISMHCNASVLSKPHDCQIFYHSEIKDKPLAEILFNYVDKIDHNTSRWSRENKPKF